MIEEVPLVLALSLSFSKCFLPPFYFLSQNNFPLFQFLLLSFFVFFLLLRRRQNFFWQFILALTLKHISSFFILSPSQTHKYSVSPTLSKTDTYFISHHSYLHSRCVSLICAVVISSFSLFSLYQPPHSLPLMHTSFRVHSCNHDLLSNTFSPIYNYLYFHIHT